MYAPLLSCFTFYDSSSSQVFWNIKRILHTRGFTCLKPQHDKVPVCRLDVEERSADT